MCNKNHPTSFQITDSTPLHIATEGGHFEVVKMLMDSGASASDENKVMRLVISCVSSMSSTQFSFT